MRKIFSIILMIITSCSYASVNTFTVYLIYYKLVGISKIKNPPKLIIEDTETQLNGWYSKEDNTITITKPLVDSADEDTVAMTLGHELTHAKYKHQVLPIMSTKTLYKQELLADKGGKILTEKAGYNACKGFLWLYNMHAKKSVDHPSSDYRWKAMGCNKENKHGNR